MLPLVSVVIPAYNHEKYIQQTIESILQQTYSEIELIVIDDGSTDGTWNVIEKMKEICKQRFVNVIFMSRENKGVCQTANEGIKLANGKYIKPMASDDYLVPTAIETFVSFFENNDQVEIAFSDGFRIESQYLSNMELDQGRIIRFSEYFPFENGNLFERLLSDVFRLPSPAVFYTKQLIERIGYYDERLSFEDVDFFLRAARETNFYFIDDILVYHRMHENNSGRNVELLVKSAQMLSSKYDEAFCGGKENWFKLQTTIQKNLSQIPMDIVRKMRAENKKIIVWGAGSFFAKYKERIPFEYVVDRNVKSAQERWPNISIKEPEVLLTEKRDDIFIVVCSVFFEEIFEWLNKHGFDSNKHYI